MKMDTHCFALKSGKVPLVIFIWGHSEELANSVFQLFQTAECPRRLKVFAFESQQAGLYAASQQEELQKFRGLQDTSFLEQISWILSEEEDPKTIRPLRDLHSQINNGSFVEKELPISCLMKAMDNFRFKKGWDSTILDNIHRLSGTSELFSATANSFSRIHAKKGTPHVEWIPLFGAQDKIQIVFPSNVLVGPTANILEWISVMHREWPYASDEALFFLTGLSLHLFQLQSLNVLSSMDSLQKMKSRNVKELTARYPGQTSLLIDQHILGLDPSSPKWEIVAKYKSMREFDTNLQEIKKMNQNLNECVHFQSREIFPNYKKVFLK